MYETTGEKNFKWLHAARQVQSKSVTAPRFQIGLKIRYLQIFFFKPNSLLELLN